MAKNDRYKDYTPMRVLTINIPDEQRLAIDTLVVNGFYPSRSEFIRDAIRRRFLDMERLDDIIAHILDDDPTTIRVPNGDGTYNDLKIVRRLE